MSDEEKIIEAESTAIERTDQRQGLEVLGSTEEMKKKLALSSARLKMVYDFIRDEENFTKGIDYGIADERSKKPTLLKPGAEKVCKLFGTRPTWRRDLDTWEMLGKPAGTVCFICEIVDNTTGEIVGEGRGAERVGNKTRDANKAIKIAEKCALVDAALNTFGLSEKFTQDSPKEEKGLNALKDELLATVEVLRAGCASSLSHRRFIVHVAKQHIGQATIPTPGAVLAIRTAIEGGLYDLETGDKIPE